MSEGADGEDRNRNPDYEPDSVVSSPRRFKEVWRQQRGQECDPYEPPAAE